MTQEDELNEAWCKYMGKFSTEIMQALAFALRWADAHPHWISVEDGLPPLGCSMIVLVSYGEDIQISEWDNGLFHEIELGVIIHPTHWMPMPEAPHHIIDANKKVDRVIGTADHIKTALDVLNKKGGEE